MELAAAILCDHASVREGLLIAVGGGITRLWRDQLPAGLGVDLALLLELTHLELGVPLEVLVDVIDEDGRQLSRMQTTVQVQSTDLDPGETQLVPLPLKLGAVAVDHYGRFSIEISLEGRHVRSVGFRVLPRRT